MQHKENRTYTRTEDVVVKTTCDICGKSQQRDRSWDGGPYDVNEVEIKYTEGESYPECHFGTRFEVDICPECFKKELIPFLKSKGATIREEKYDN